MNTLAAVTGASLGDHALTSPADASTIYNCPNLPKVDRTSPGNCPKCGSRLEPKDPTAALEEDESPELVKDKLATDPGAHLGDRAPAPSADASDIHNCPNLPEVDRIGPGNCPKCGMPLEPRNPIAAPEEDENPDAGVWTSLMRWCWPWAT